MIKKSLYAKSMFMILIILTLPFYISAAYAQTNLEVRRYSGDDNVNGFFDRYDRWVLETTASVEGDSEITEDQVRINGFNMQDCSKISLGIYNCSFQSSYYTLAADTYTSKVELFSDDNISLMSKEISMTTDSLPPIINFDRLPVQNGSVVSVGYVLKDRAWKEDDFSICSGLKKIEFWDNAVKLAERNITSSSCIYSGTSIVPLPSSGNLLLKAYDKMDHAAAESSPQFEIDAAAPSIRTDTFKMMSQGVELKEYIPAGSFPIMATIHIIEKGGLKAENVAADFSQFGEGSSVKAGTCVRSGNEYTCAWPTLTFSIKTGTYNIKVSATDDFGNKQEATVVKSFTVDTTKPNIISVGTRNPWNSISYIGSNPTEIFARISDTGAGLGGRQILMDLSEIDGSYAGKYFQANICEKPGADWECVWTPITSTKSHGTRGNFYIIKGFDDAGNEVQGVKQGSFFIDKRAPIVKEIGTREYASITAITETGINVLSSGDDLIAEVEVQDDSKVTGLADFSGIMGQFGYENVEGECETENNKDWKCVWEIGPVASGYLDEDVAFTFIDSAGNNRTVKQRVEVYAKSFEESPDYWTAVPLEPMPRALDRSTTTLINHKMYFPISLRTSSSAELVSSALLECSGDTGYLNNIFIFNNEAGNKNFFTGMWFKAFEPPADYLTVKCTLNLQSIYRKQLLQNYEKESVEFQIRFYDPPLGEASASIKEEIEDEIDEWIDTNFWKTIEFLYKIFEWCNLLCKTYYTYRLLVQVKDWFEELFHREKQALEATVVGAPAAAAAEAQRATACYSTEAAHGKANKAAEFFDKFCGFINCKLGPLPEGQKKEGLEYWGSVLGGGGGIAAQINEFYSQPGMGPSFTNALGRFSGTEDYTRAGGKGGYLNVKDNWILSLLTICLPGIIYNLQKLRGIHCFYIDCLINSVKAGVSTNMCSETKSYQECKYFWGAIFQLIPWLGFYNYILKLIKNAISDPMALIGVGLSATCSFYCPGGRNPHKLCILTKLLATLGDALTNIEQIFDPEVWELKNDPCIALEETLEEAEELGLDVDLD